MHRLLPLLLIAVLLLTAAPAAALADGCPAGQPIPADFTAGFAALNDALGGAMGAPAECEYADHNGSGDTLQHTTGGRFGLAYWRKSTNTPIWYDGATHWAVGTDGNVFSWPGPSADPPGVVQAAQPPVVQPSPPAVATSPATFLVRCRTYCFMVPDGRGQAAIATLASIGAGSLNPLALLAIGRAVTSGDFYRLTPNATIQIDTPDAEYLPHITVLDGAHEGAVGHTNWAMLAAR